MTEGDPERDFPCQGARFGVRTAEELDGLVVYTRAAHFNLPLSTEGKKLLARITNANEWYQVQRSINEYTGHEIQIFNGAMQKALKLGRYKQGAAIYKKLCNSRAVKQQATYTAAITIHSRLGRPDAVRGIWDEALNTCGMDSILAAARIRAAADEGDFVTAATILDKMNSTSTEINAVHVSSAIRACWTANGTHYNVAKYLFYDVMARLDVQPNKITFNNFIGALRGAPVTDLVSAYQTMRNKGITPDAVTAELFLMSLFPKPRNDRWNTATAAARLRDKDKEKLDAARTALKDFKASHVELSELSCHIDAALQLLAAEGL